MKRTALFCFLLLACARLAAAEDSPIPKKLKAFAGNTWVGPYHVELEAGDTLFYWRGGPQDKDKAEQIKPSADQWREFRRELDAIGIWKWREDYSTRAIYDATGWIFEVEYADKKIKTGGDSGVFPDATGAPVRFGSPHAEDYYARYVQALRKLLGLYQFPI